MHANLQDNVLNIKVACFSKTLGSLDMKHLLSCIDSVVYNLNDLIYSFTE